MAEVVRITDRLNVTRSLMVCTNCKAMCEPKDRARFKRRHPDKCLAHTAGVVENKAFSKKLAQGTRCVDFDDWRKAMEEYR